MVRRTFCQKNLFEEAFHIFITDFYNRLQCFNLISPGGDGLISDCSFLKEPLCGSIFKEWGACREGKEKERNEKRKR